MRTLFIDSSAFLSLESNLEERHNDTRDALREAVEGGARLCTSNFVFDETYTLVLTRLGRTRAIRWGDGFRQGKIVALLRVGEDHEERAWEILKTFDDHDFSYTDATSFAVIESLGLTEALSLDRHFRAYGRLTVLP